jgi:hypothetical protein
VSVTLINKSQTNLNRIGAYAGWVSQPPPQLLSGASVAASFTYNIGDLLIRNVVYGIPTPDLDAFSLVISIDANGNLTTDTVAPPGYTAGAITGDNEVDFIMSKPA